MSPKMIVTKIIYCNIIIKALDEMHMSNEFIGEVPFLHYPFQKSNAFNWNQPEEGNHMEA